MKYLRHVNFDVKLFHLVFHLSFMTFLSLTKHKYLQLPQKYDYGKIKKTSMPLFFGKSTAKKCFSPEPY